MKTPKALFWSTYTLVFVCASIPCLIGSLFGLGGASECIPSRTMPLLHILLIGIPSTVIAGFIGTIVAKPLMRKLFKGDKSILASSFFVVPITLVACIITYNASCLFGSLGNFIREYFFITETYKTDPAGQIIDRVLLTTILITYYKLNCGPAGIHGFEWQDYLESISDGPIRSITQQTSGN